MSRSLQNKTFITQCFSSIQGQITRQQQRILAGVRDGLLFYGAQDLFWTIHKCDCSFAHQHWSVCVICVRSAPSVQFWIYPNKMCVHLTTQRSVRGVLPVKWQVYTNKSANSNISQQVCTSVQLNVQSDIWELNVQSYVALGCLGIKCSVSWRP